MSPVLKPRGSVFNARVRPTPPNPAPAPSRQFTAPLAALTMACLLYTYSVTSIRAAKRNAQLHREADGGQLDMRRESLRRHGVLDKVPRTGGVELFRDAKGEEGRGATGEIGAVAGGEGRARALGERDERGREKSPRTRVEGSLEGYKGRGSAVERFRQGRPDVPEG